MIDKELHRIKDYSLDELYSELFTTSEEGQGMLGAPGVRKLKGKSIFSRYEKALKNEVCDKWNACLKIKQYKNILELSASVATIIAPVIPQLSPFVAAMIISKIGIKKFCNCKD